MGVWCDGIYGVGYGVMLYKVWVYGVMVYKVWVYGVMVYTVWGMV